MEASVIISYYRNIPNLELVLLALNNQSAKGTFEVIVSEDDDSKETIDFLNQIRPKLSFPIIHVSQPNEGFRKCTALNKSIRASTTDFLIFLDGDCVPHKQLVKEYIQSKQQCRVLYGRRVMLSSTISDQLLKEKKLGLLSFFNLVRRGCKRPEEGLYLPFVPQRFKTKTSGRLLGCNMGIGKKEMLTINGFDEDYARLGNGEDTDIEWRLESSGASFFSTKFTAIVYHLYHPERPLHDLKVKSQEMLDRKMQQGFFVCKNGYEKIA